MIFGRKRRRITRILLVEDEPLVAFDNEHVLSDAGYTIIDTVPSVAGAVAALSDDVELVLTDVSLPDGSGVEVARAARDKGVPVLFVTGACPAEAAELAAGCLAKPYAPRDLLGAIRAIDAQLAGGKVPKLPDGFTLFAAPVTAGER